MKKVKLLIIFLLIYSLSLASTTITFTRADGVIGASEFSTVGVSEIINGYVSNNCLQQDNTDVPGTIKITFTINQTVVNLDYIRDPYYSLDNHTLGVDYTSLTAYDGENGTGNIIASESLISSGQFELVGNNNIKSIVINGSYDNYGHFNDFDNLFFDVNPPALPVELTYFSAEITRSLDGAVLVDLSWETATEVNNYGFEIFRDVQDDSQADFSDDSEAETDKESWENIAFVNGNGNSNSPKIYSYTDEINVMNTKIAYRLKQVDIDGRYKYSNIINVSPSNVITQFKLEQNYPNPFNPNTIIKYSIPDNDGTINDLFISVYDQIGREVESVTLPRQNAGNYQYLFNGKYLSSGIYIYSIKYGDLVKSNKMILMK